MLRVFRLLCSKLDSYRHKRGIQRALALHHRGEARKDGLTPTNITTHLEIEWRARDVHPWDRCLLSPAERAAAFVKQALADTEAAIRRLFATLPNVDVITLKVLDRRLENVIISGTVSRPGAVSRNDDLSTGMRLSCLGLTFHSAGCEFEPLEKYDRRALRATNEHE